MWVASISGLVNCWGGFGLNLCCLVVYFVGNIVLVLGFLGWCFCLCGWVVACLLWAF